MRFFVRRIAAISLLTLAACGAPQPPALRVAEGYTAGNYHISEIVIKPTDQFKAQDDSYLTGTLENFEEFKKNLLPVLSKALSKEKKGPALKMSVYVVSVSADINPLKAALITDGISVRTVVELKDVAKNTVVLTENIGITTKMQMGLLGMITDPDDLSHDQNQQDLVQKYVQRLMYKLFPGKYPFI